MSETEASAARTAMSGADAEGQPAASARRRDGRLIVDAQNHIWLASTPDRPWHLPDAKPQMAEPFTAERLIPMMNEAGVERAILVPPSWAGGRFGNAYAAEAAKAYPGRFGVIGIGIALDDRSQESVVINWRSEPGFLGIRPALTREALTSRQADWFWSAAQKAAIPICFLASGLNSLVGNVAERFPELTLIADHMGISSAFMKSNPDWREEVKVVANLAKYPNISVKVSSIPFLSSQPYPWRDTFDLVQRCFDEFGPLRCHWGTDQTHSFDKASYGQRITQFTEEMTFLSERDKDWIMGRSLLARIRWP
jgi:predicted TIM-barrel fold metal-dependent hydrolase